MNKTFVTIVPHIDNIELRKDTGQLPYHFGKLSNVQTKLVTYFYTLEGGRKLGASSIPPESSAEIDYNYPYLKSETRGLNILFLPFKGRRQFFEKAILDYLNAESKNIDVLNLFHFSAENVFYCLFYKLRNPKGKIYIKLDIDVLFYKSRKNFFNVGGKFGFIKNWVSSKILLPLFFNKVTLFSAESKEGLEYFTNRFPLSKNKTILIYNGVDRERIETLAQGLLPFEKKENIVIVVGPPGDVNKNHTFLLQALKNIDLGAWKIYFVGKIINDFDIYINKFFLENPQLKESIIFTGHISDPLELYKLYNKSKIFCMPSLGEGFPLSAVEAATFGNVLLLSENIYSYNALTNNGEGGEKFSLQNTHDLELKITKLFSESDTLYKKHQFITQYAQREFDWKQIVKKIKNYLD